MVAAVAARINETVTNPEADGWFDAAGLENTDKCLLSRNPFGPTFATADGARANLRLGARNFLVPQNWVNDEERRPLRAARPVSPVRPSPVPARVSQTGESERGLRPRRHTYHHILSPRAGGFHALDTRWIESGSSRTTGQHRWRRGRRLRRRQSRDRRLHRGPAAEPGLPPQLLRPASGGGGAPAGAPALSGATGAPVNSSPEETTSGEFVTFVLNDVQDTWTEVFAKNGQTYRHAKLVLFRDGDPLGLRLRPDRDGAVLLPGRREGLHRPRLLQGAAGPLRRLRRLRAGLRHRPRVRPPRAEPAGDQRQGGGRPSSRTRGRPSRCR